MRRIIRVLSCVLALSVLLPMSGCHKAAGRASFAIPEQFDESKQYEVTFWAKNDTNKTQVSIYQNAITSFEALYPNIHVNLRLYTDYNKIYNDVITNIATGTTPDVCITYPDHIATYMTGSNVVVPLDDLLVNEKYGLGGSEVKFDAPKKEEVIDQYLEEGKIDDSYYILPYMRSTEAVYINKTYVEALGYTVPDVLTWDFIWEVSEAATAKNPDGTYVVNHQNVLIPFIYKSTDNMMIQMLHQLDAGYSDDAGTISIFNDTTTSLLKQISEHASTGAFSTFKLSGYPANFLNAGQCIFAIDSTAGSTWMGSGAPLSDIAEENKVDFETVVRDIPQYDAEHPSMISQGPSICLFNSGNQDQVLASWLFAQYLLTDEVQCAYAETEGYVPVTSKAQQSEEYQEYLSLAGSDADHYDVKIAATQMLLDHIDDTFVTSVFNGSTSLRNAAGQLIEDTVKAVKRKQDVNDAFIQKTYDNVMSLYRLDQIQQQASLTHKADLGKLPDESRWLLIILGVTWGVIGCVQLKKRMKVNKHHA